MVKEVNPPIAEAPGKTTDHEIRTSNVRMPFLHRFSALLGQWRRRLRDRNALAAMCARSLRDIGLTRHDAELEARKPFWRA
jgi:uncharacterized protein YjiS (DUF1127 family)